MRFFQMAIVINKRWCDVIENGQLWNRQAEGGNWFEEFLLLF